MCAHIASSAMSDCEEDVGEASDSDSDSTNEAYRPTCPSYKPGTVAPVAPEEGFTEECRLKRIELANYGLSYYNNKNGTKYELAEDETIETCFFINILERVIHCCFYAVYSSIKRQFFAEIKFPYPSQPTVSYCMIIEGETKVGCERCSSVTHPVAGFQGALVSNKDDCKVDREIVENAKEPKNESSATGTYPPAGWSSRYKMESYKPTCPSYEPGTAAAVAPKDFTEENRLKRIKLANYALRHYNYTNGTKYELAEDETIETCFFINILERAIHCCFYAVYSSTKQVYVEDSSLRQSTGEDSSIKRQFFAEIKYPYPSQPTVSYCMIIEGETKVGCERCSSVTHPVVGYRGSLMSSKDDCKVDRKIVENAKELENKLHAM